MTSRPPTTQSGRTRATGKRVLWLAIPLVLLGRNASVAVVERPAPVATTACEALPSLSIPDTVLTSAPVVTQTPTLPAHCRVVGVTHGEPGVERSAWRFDFRTDGTASCS